MSHKKLRTRGRFIVFEGIDGAGTTTQARVIADWLRGRGERVFLTAEPTSGPVGSLLRQVLRGRLVTHTAQGETRPLDPATIALLFAADRLDHIDAEIRPHLEAGTHVICDRYVVSSLAYQSVEVDLRFVRQINGKAIAPDLTLFLRVSAEVAMARIDKTRPHRDAFETLPLQRKVAAGYDQVLEDYRDGELVTLDGEQDVSWVTARVRAEIEKLL
jgi:dTMP kinase